MIKSFADDSTELLFLTGSSRRLAQEIQKSGLRALRALHQAGSLNDLRGEGRKLEVRRDGTYSIRINDKYRLIFRWDGDAHDVIVTDPH